MESVCHFVIILALVIVLSAWQCEAQSPGASVSPARALDALLQDYAYHAFVRPRTGIPYDGTVPSNLTGIKVAAVRLRSGSLKRKGVPSYKEFEIPVGVVEQPYVERLVLVYQNLGNWSAFYYPLTGYSYLTPLLGLLAYDAANLSATNLPELDLVASQSPISIKFTNVNTVPSGLVARCVWFGLDGTSEFRDLLSTNVCSTYRQGHFSIVINSTNLAPPPSPSAVPEPSPAGSKKKKSKVAKIIGGLIGGILGLILLAFLIFWMQQYIRNKKLAEMERCADSGVVLQTATVGNTQAPVASGTRTQPVIENEYVA